MSDAKFTALQDIPGHIASFSASASDGRVLHTSRTEKETTKEAQAALRLLRDATRIARQVPELEHERLQRITAMTDIAMPLPKGWKPKQQLDWGWLPVLVVIAIIAFVYWVYLDPLCLALLRMGHRAQAIVYLVFMNIGLAMVLISYARIVSCRPGYPKASIYHSVGGGWIIDVPL
ncbi:uncharacterized protein BYT42DRAFT_611011 [Radiomyces spectabilis]|uniref:uncharacterized protein n=1 Tax=Radiomyces spectabilis TaxID=64574 RepID=UPI00222090D8|nr:uncharacterized protein BYT42DRAFT_611011 [Radiomyces spectabilis]KAI8391827.1 hypothetical protein BYT42DRAFT_611011 [Radiomyces spectabilis]